MKNIKHYFKGFTLVELIIVITILAILATIAFISFQDYTKDARDANRVSTLKNIETWLELFTLKTWNFPKPDDPKDKSNYVYSTFWSNNRYYQIWIDSESQEISFLPQVYAKSKTSIVKWNYKFDPSLPSLILVENEALMNSWIFSPEVCFVLDWGKNSLKECSKIKSEINLKDFDNSLVWYWDMESLTWNLLKDLSGYGNHWIGSGWIAIWWTGGKIWNATYFHGQTIFNPSWVKQFIKINDSETLKNFWNQVTISTISYASQNNNWWRFLFHRYTEPISWWQDKTYIYWNYATTSWLQGYINLNEYNSTWWIIAVAPLKDLVSIFNYGWNYYMTTSVYNWKSLKIYLNWILMNEKTFDGKNQEANNRSIYSWTWANFIWSWCYNLNCQYPNNPTQTFNWIIDDVKIYNRALTSEEIFQQSKIAWF